MPARYSIYQDSCERCGRKVWTTDKGLYGQEIKQNKYGKVCQRCVTEQEIEEEVVLKG